MEPFDFKTISPNARPSTEELNRIASTERRALTFLLEQQYAARTAFDNARARQKTGFIGDGFSVRPLDPAGFQVEVAAGLGFYYDPTDPLVAATDSVVGVYQGTIDLAPNKPLVLGSSILVTITPPPAAGLSRIDVIEVRPKRDLDDYGPKLRYDRAARGYRPKSAADVLRYGSTQSEVGLVQAPALSTTPVSYKRGVAQTTGTEVEPDVTPGYVKIARIRVKDSTASITRTEICDLRPGNHPDGVGVVTGRASIRTVRNQYVRPQIKSLNAPAGVRVAIFYRDKVAMTKFVVSPNIMLFHGAPITQLTGSVTPVNSLGTPAPMDNEAPLIAHGLTTELNRQVQTVDIDSGELQDSNLAYPAGLYYGDFEYFSTLHPNFCAWNTGTSLWDRDMSQFDPLEFDFRMEFSY